MIKDSIKKADCAESEQAAGAEAGAGADVPLVKGPRSKAECKRIVEDTMRVLDPHHPSIANTVAYGPAELGKLLESQKNAYAAAAASAAAAGADAASKAPRTKTSVLCSRTIEAAVDMCTRGGGAVCALNFSSAKNPGGGFLNGQPKGQEESLCRSSGLYLCIKDQKVYNLARKDNRQCLYHDFVIFSPNVPVIKDSAGIKYPQPFQVSFLTSPAPNAGNAVKKGVAHAEIVKTMAARIDHVLNVAVAHDQRRLVLGSWGTGCFGNDPNTVAELFCKSLARKEIDGAFDEVVFAVSDPRHVDIFRTKLGC
jgi:uncharacterized protein (TIGR02452 family)